MFSDMKEHVKELVLKIMEHNNSITMETIESNLKSKFEQLDSLTKKINDLEVELKSLKKVKEDNEKMIEAYQAIYRIKEDLKKVL